MIPYGIDVGFAIGRLIGVFYEVCAQIAGDGDRVHFAFSTIGSGEAPNLPRGFSNLLEFNHRAFRSEDAERLATYVTGRGARHSGVGHARWLEMSQGRAARRRPEHRVVGVRQ
jgi:hypothetical protein